jgi:hypothetical protein
MVCGHRDRSERVSQRRRDAGVLVVRADQPRQDGGRASNQQSGCWVGLYIDADIDFRIAAWVEFRIEAWINKKSGKCKSWAKSRAKRKIREPE